MSPEDLHGVLAFLRSSETLKVTLRSGYTSRGERESVAEHTWRICLMALVLRPEFPEIDFSRLLEICIVHDLGEAIGGDVPAPLQKGSKSAQERQDLLQLLEPLPARTREHITELWDEYEAARTPEARLAKALDKLETLMQHTQGSNPPDFDYRFNLSYARACTESPSLIATIREILDRDTLRRVAETGLGSRAGPGTAGTAPTSSSDL
jgi:putative hydrolase of HD superfamily